MASIELLKIIFQLIKISPCFNLDDGFDSDDGFETASCNKQNTLLKYLGFSGNLKSG